MNKDDCNHRIRSKFKYYLVKRNRENNENSKNAIHYMRKCLSEVKIKTNIKEKREEKI